jgi:hypothetical protein
MTANKAAITNATLQPSLIAGVAALMVRVTAGRIIPSARAACPTKLMVMGGFQLSYFETRPASGISANSSVASRRGLLGPTFPFCKVAVAAYKFEIEAGAFL